MTCPVCSHTNRPNAHYCSQCRAPLVLQNKYQITQQIGRGGFGAVYQAAQTNLGGALCAIKELLPDANVTPQELQQSATQFQFEARVLAELSHPALPKVTDFFLEGNRYYLVMEFVPGETLENLLARNAAPLPEAQLIEWTKTLCDVLTYLHTRQPPIIHRDIKPANIKITPDGQVKLIDFGIAKLLVAGTGTAAAARAVSAPYSPWEQYGKGKGTDARSDIYALGATMYQLLTNHLPPDAPDRANEALIPPRQWNSLLSPSTDALIVKALAVRPEDRFQNALEMKRAMSAPTPRPQPAPTVPVGTSFTPIPQPIGGYAPPIINQQTQTQKNVLTKTVIVLAISLVIVVSGIIVAVQQTMQQQAQATQTAQAIAATTMQAQTTSTAQAGFTGTAQVYGTVVSQIRATMTAEAQSTATARAKSGALLFSDTFDTNANLWKLGNFDDEWAIGQSVIANGKFHLNISAKKGTNYKFTPVMSSASDVQLNADCQKVSGPSNADWGVMFRLLDYSNFYFFYISDRSYKLNILYNGEWTTLINWTQSQAIRTGEVNRLGVKAQGSHIVLFINDQQVGETNDSRLSSGKVGIAVELYNPGDQAVFEFDNLEVRTP